MRGDTVIKMREGNPSAHYKYQRNDSRRVYTRLKMLIQEYGILWHDRRDVLLVSASAFLSLMVGMIAYISNAYSTEVNQTVGVGISLGSGMVPIVRDLLLEWVSVGLEAIGIPRPSTIYPLFLASFSIVALILRLGTLGNHSCAYTRRILTILSVVYGVRALMVSATVIPTPNPECSYVLRSNIIETAVYNVLLGNESCGDVFYSGHTILFTTTIYAWVKKPSRLLPFVGYLIIGIIAILGYSSLIISRLHYTVDILSGLWFTLTTILIYEWIINLHDLRHTWYSRALRWWDYSPDYAASEGNIIFVKTDSVGNIHLPSYTR